MSAGAQVAPSDAVVLCELSDLCAGSGVAILHERKQIALFYLPDESPEVYAIGNFDPIGRANILSRGIVGDVKGKLVVASPMYKQHFDLQSGICVEDAEVNVPVYPVSVVNQQVVLLPS